MVLVICTNPRHKQRQGLSARLADERLRQKIVDDLTVMLPANREGGG
ncbi:MAG: 50S ribosomal protein L36 [Pseudomonadota bacterium]